MKHNFKIILILLSIFVVTQFVGLYVISSDPFHISQKIDGQVVQVENPALSWIQPPEVQQESDFHFYLGSIIFAFVAAILILFFLTKFKIDFILKAWFFIVVALALFISFTAIFPRTIYFAIPFVLISLGLSFLKVFKGNFILHNLTEILIYPGISTVFIPILNLWSVITLLIIISIYDIWAVWHSGIMQKMAKYQMNNLKIFSGFFIPYVSKKLKDKWKKMKNKKNKKVKVSVAILGGGDVIFPIITSGVVLMTKSISLPFGLLPQFVFHGGFLASLFVVFGATLGLAFLFIISKKKKFYPAMPFITAGVFAGLVLSQLFY